MTEPASQRDIFQVCLQANTPTRGTFSPSRGKITLPIPAKRPNNDHDSPLGRAQLQREGENVTQKGAAGKRCGSNARKCGESLIRVGAVGIRIRKTPPRFPNYLGRRTNFPPHQGTTGSNQQQGRGLKTSPNGRATGKRYGSKTEKQEKVSSNQAQGHGFMPKDKTTKHKGRSAPGFPGISPPT